jgi:hypothetical protein
MPRQSPLATGAAVSLLLFASACQVPNFTDLVPQVPALVPANPVTASSLKDKALAPMANVMVMSAQATGQMAGSSAQAVGSIAAMPFRSAMAVQQASPALPPTAIPAGMPGGFGLPIPVGVPSSMPWKQFWDWRDGWYWSKFNVGDRLLKFRFEDVAGTPATVDVMDMALYGMPPKMTGFPKALVKFHTEFANSYPFGVTVTSTLYGDIPPAPPTAETRLPQQGTGTVQNVPVIGSIAFTVAADANGAGNDVKGKLVHTVVYGGATYVGESAMNLNGMLPPATIKRDGAPVAEVRQSVTAGRWEIVAEGQTLPVDAVGVGLGL